MTVVLPSWHSLRFRYGGRARATLVMNKSRALFLALVVALLCALVAPSGAQSADPRAKRDEIRKRRADLAAQLDTIKASETELLQAAKALDDQVGAQQARVAAANQAVAAAEREVAEAAASLAQTKEIVVQIHGALVQRAVKAYMTPSDDNPTDIAPSGDLAEGARRRALLESVAASDDDLLDELDAAREDYELQQAAAQRAKEQADARRAEADQRLRKLEADQAEAERLRDAVSARRQEVLSEITAQDAADAALRKVIAESDARAAREAARRAARSSASSGSGGSGGGSSGGTRSGGCIWPTRGSVTSEYGSRWGRQHAGIDIAAPMGTPIWAARSGLVIFAGQQSGYGNVIIIDHGDMTTLYAHQSRLFASSGQSVAQGEQIGAIGNTGRSTGPHVHFETRYGGSPRNPRNCLP